MERKGLIEGGRKHLDQRVDDAKVRNVPKSYQGYPISPKSPEIFPNLLKSPV